MSPYLIDRREAIRRFQKALLKVAPEYFSVLLPQKQRQWGERIFAYELYHQLRCEFKEYWYVHGEFRKGLRLVPSIGLNTTVVPDIVIHQSDNLRENLIVVEIKSSPRTSARLLSADLKKLELYTRPSGLDFRIGILLASNFDASQVICQARRATQNRILQLIKTGPRTAIWNIVNPIPDKNSNSGALNAPSLKIILASDVEQLINEAQRGQATTKNKSARKDAETQRSRKEFF